MVAFERKIQAKLCTQKNNIIDNNKRIKNRKILPRCPKGNAAEAVAEKLDKKLRDNLKDARNSLFGR